MKVAVTGSTGLLGRALCSALRDRGDVVLPVVRSQDPARGEVGWDPASGVIDGHLLEGVDAVVHLAGAGIGDRRWSDDRKRLLIESRVRSTTLLAETLAGLDAKPAVLLSGSAIGFYGDRGDEVLTESAPAGDDFLAQLCVDWEAATAPAVDAGIRTAMLRTGIVQARSGGALAKTLVPFRLGLGGRFGSGKQWVSWISIDDHIRAVQHLLDVEIRGPVNLTAPKPVTNAEYTKAIGRELGRPTVIPLPKLATRIMLGRELADSLLHFSTRVIPDVLSDSGFSFRHSDIRTCLAAVLGDRELA